MAQLPQNLSVRLSAQLLALQPDMARHRQCGPLVQKQHRLCPDGAVTLPHLLRPRYAAVGHGNGAQYQLLQGAIPRNQPSDRVGVERHGTALPAVAIGLGNWSARSAASSTSPHADDASLCRAATSDVANKFQRYSTVNT